MHPRPTELRVVSFDCYGTLVDWAAAVVGWAARAAPALAADPPALLARFAALESERQAGPFRSYRAVLAEVQAALAPQGAPADGLAWAIADAHPFLDAIPALRRLKASGLALCVVSNVDPELFARTSRALDVGFDLVVTSGEIGAYKPDPRPLLALRERLVARGWIGADGAGWLHCAQSSYHDLAPARALGIATCRVDRGDPLSAAAVPPSAADPDGCVADLGALAERVG